MRYFNRTIIAATMLLWSQASAAQVSCTGTPTGVFTNTNGSLVAQMPWRQDWVGVCNVKTSWKGIDPSICWTWFTFISTAIAEQKPILVSYSGASNCASIATYENSPAPYYVRLDAQ